MREIRRFEIISIQLRAGIKHSNRGEGVFMKKKKRLLRAKLIITLVLICIFITYYIWNTGVRHISIPQLLFIPGIFILAFLIEIALIRY